MTEEDKARVAPGWFPAGDLPGMQRYWDGSGWSDEIRATPPKKAPPGFSPTSTRDDPAYAWTIALTPLVGAVVILVAPKVGNSLYLWLGIYATTVLLCYLDEKRLAAKDALSPSMAGTLFVPIYLIDRTRLVGSTAAIPILWFATFGASVLAGFLAPSAYSYNQAEMNRTISKGISDQVGGAVTVRCPKAHREYSGDTIRCTATDSTGTAKVVVTFGDGTYRYELVQ